MPDLLRPLKWFYNAFGIVSIHDTGRNAYLIILARACRMLAYGTNSLILAIFFSALKFSDHRIGIFMTLTLLGDVFLGTYLTLIADRVGRRKVLLGGSALMITSGVVFAVFENFWILLLAAVLGVISVFGGDSGPFRSIEESVLSQLTTTATRSDVLAWYVTMSAFGSSIGSEVSGRILRYLQAREGWTDVDAYHALFWVYTVMGFVNVAFTLALTEDCELDQTQKKGYASVSQNEGLDEDTEQVNGSEQQPLEREPQPIQPKHADTWLWKATHWITDIVPHMSGSTRSIVYKLWFLLSLDSLADGMVPYTLTNYYMDIKFHPSKSTLGDITSSSYFLSAIGAVFAGPLARKIGLVNTMVFTHVPSSAAVLVFAMPSQLWMTAALLLIRAGLNNMDQAPRAALISAVVKPEERTAIIGITSTLRTLAATAGPSVTGVLAANEQFWIAFVAAGVCRLSYDFGLYAMFINIKVDNGDGIGQGSKFDSQPLPPPPPLDVDQRHYAVEEDVEMQGTVYINDGTNAREVQR